MNTQDTNTNTQVTYTEEDMALGYKVIDRVIETTAIALSVFSTIACSSFLVGLIVGVLMALLTYALALLAKLLVRIRVQPETAGSLGHAIGGMAFRVNKLFSFARKNEVTA